MFQQDVFNLLFEGVSEGVIVVYEHQKIIATNTSIETMFGYNKKELNELKTKFLSLVSH